MLPLMCPKAQEPFKSSARTWAWAFLLSGSYALVCVPAVFLFEQLGWQQAPLHATKFFACIICAVSAMQYLSASRADATNATVLPVLARIALALTLGFFLLCGLVAVLWAVVMRDF